jgi:hypothetical protein
MAFVPCLLNRNEFGTAGRTGNNERGEPDVRFMANMVRLCELAMYATAVPLPELVVTIGLLYAGNRFLLQLGGVHEATSAATPFVTPVAVAVGKGKVWLVVMPFVVVFIVVVCTVAVAA